MKGGFVNRYSFAFKQKNIFDIFNANEGNLETGRKLKIQKRKKISI